MSVLTIEDIIKATGGRLVSENVSSFPGVSIDSRTIQKGEIFFALRGPRFDGHEFIKEAITKGAGGAVIESSKLKAQSSKLTDVIHHSPFTVIMVPDTLKALQDLAHFLRMGRDIPVIAVTGSNGKTTTKEMIYRILSRRFNVLKNTGNLNNHIGVPLSFLKIKPDDGVAVLEFGMNASGEIRRLCEIVNPTYGVITNIGPAHIGRLGTLEAVRSAKLEILNGLQRDTSPPIYKMLRIAVLNADDDFLMQGVRDFKGEIITFSIKNDSHVRAEDVVMTDNGSRFTLVFSDSSDSRGEKDNDRTEVSLSLSGIFNVYNALAASAVCFSLGVTIDEIKMALEAYRAFPMRFEVMRRKKITLINDSYNANPSSMTEALKGLAYFKEKGRLVAVLGDMNELGKFSEEAHMAVGKMVSEMGIDVFIAVGEMMTLAAEESKRHKNGVQPVIYTFMGVSEAKQKILDIIREGDTVLVKGSRSMTMEKIVERIKEAAEGSYEGNKK